MNTKIRYFQITSEKSIEISIKIELFHKKQFYFKIRLYFMLFSIFFIYVNSKENICVCNEICSPLCSSNTFIGSKFDSNLFKLLKTENNEDNEIEIVFYSRTKYFNFIFDLNYFEKKELILTTLSDSKPIAIRFQNDSKISNTNSITIVITNTNNKTNFSKFTIINNKTDSFSITKSKWY